MHCRTCGHELADQAVACVACGCPPLAGNKFCQSCGAETNPAATVCVKCGVPLRAAAVPGPAGDRIAASNPPKDPVLMAVLSGCCIVGLGQMILGQTGKGVAILLGSIALGAITLGISALITLPIAAVDAYLIAKKLKEGKTVGPWEFF